MEAVVAKPESLREMFAAFTEQTFQVDLGIADTRLTDYLTKHAAPIHPVRCHLPVSEHDPAAGSKTSPP